MPAEIEAKVAALGAVINPPETAKLYAPLQEKEPYHGVKVARDLKYGPDDTRSICSCRRRPPLRRAPC